MDDELGDIFNDSASDQEPISAPVMASTPRPNKKLTKLRQQSHTKDKKIRTKYSVKDIQLRSNLLTSPLRKSITSTGIASDDRMAINPSDLKQHKSKASKQSISTSCDGIGSAFDRLTHRPIGQSVESKNLKEFDSKLFWNSVINRMEDKYKDIDEEDDEIIDFENLEIIDKKDSFKKRDRKEFGYFAENTLEDLRANSFIIKEETSGHSMASTPPPKPMLTKKRKGFPTQVVSGVRRFVGEPKKQPISTSDEGIGSLETWVESIGESVKLRKRLSNKIKAEDNTTNDLEIIDKKGFIEQRLLKTNTNKNNESIDDQEIGSTPRHKRRLTKVRQLSFDNDV